MTADEQNDRIEGRNAVQEALRASRPIEKLFVQEGERGGPLGRLASMAREQGAAVVTVNRAALDGMSVTRAHQGVIALIACREYSTIGGMLSLAREKGEQPLIVVCDGITDENNLGAIIRTAECAGAHGLVLPKRRSAGLTATTARTSSGAVEHLPVARVPNIPSALTELKAEGLWVYGAHSSAGQSLYQTDLSGPVALVIGGEGTGISRLALERCDMSVNIPMRGRTGSLNASAAAAVIIYEIVRQRWSANA